MKFWEKNYIVYHKQLMHISSLLPFEQNKNLYRLAC